MPLSTLDPDNPFEEWLGEVASAQTELLTEGINDEALANLWSFSLSAEQASICSVEYLETFIRDIVEARRKELRARLIPPNTVVFYCWHDEMAAHLCFSLVRTIYGRLPFRYQPVVVPDIRQIVTAFLHSPHHDGIPWSEFDASSAAPEQEAEPAIPPLEVWTTLLP